MVEIHALGSLLKAMRAKTRGINISAQESHSKLPHRPLGRTVQNSFKIFLIMKINVRKSLLGAFKSITKKIGIQFCDRSNFLQLEK